MPSNNERAVRTSGMIPSRAPGVADKLFATPALVSHIVDMMFDEPKKTHVELQLRSEPQEFFANPKDLSSLALTCRGATEVALNALWSHLDSMDPLLDTIPSAFFRADSQTYTGVNGPVDLTRFAYLSKRVRSVRIDGQWDELLPEVRSLFQLPTTHSRESLFPRLREITVTGQTSPDSAAWLGWFLEYCPVTKITIDFSSERAPLREKYPSLIPMLHQIANRATFLTHLTLTLDPSALFDLPPSSAIPTRFATNVFKALTIRRILQDIQCYALVCEPTESRLSLFPVISLWDPRMKSSESFKVDTINAIASAGSISLNLRDTGFSCNLHPSQWHVWKEWTNSVSPSLALIPILEICPSIVMNVAQAVEHRSVLLNHSGLKELKLELGHVGDNNHLMEALSRHPGLERLCLANCQADIYYQSPSEADERLQYLLELDENSNLKQLRLPPMMRARFPPLHSTIKILEHLSNTRARRLESVSVFFDSSLALPSSFPDAVPIKTSNTLRRLEIQDFRKSGMSTSLAENMAIYLDRLFPNLESLRACRAGSEKSYMVKEAIQSWKEVEIIRLTLQRARLADREAQQVLSIAA